MAEAPGPWQSATWGPNGKCRHTFVHNYTSGMALSERFLERNFRETFRRLATHVHLLRVFIFRLRIDPALSYREKAQELLPTGPLPHRLLFSLRGPNRAVVKADFLLSWLSQASPWVGGRALERAGSDPSFLKWCTETLAVTRPSSCWVYTEAGIPAEGAAGTTQAKPDPRSPAGSKMSGSVPKKTPVGNTSSNSDLRYGIYSLTFLSFFIALFIDLCIYLLQLRLTKE